MFQKRTTVFTILSKILQPISVFCKQEFLDRNGIVLWESCLGIVHIKTWFCFSSKISLSLFPAFIRFPQKTRNVTKSDYVQDLISAVKQWNCPFSIFMSDHCSEFLQLNLNDLIVCRYCQQTLYEWRVKLSNEKLLISRNRILYGKCMCAFGWLSMLPVSFEL